MLWDELAQLRPISECTCGYACTCDLAKATTTLVEQRQLIQFLMGLNDEYDNVRSQILVTEPLPSVNRVYSIILRVERQRQVHLDVIVRHDGAVMHAENFEKRKEGNNFRRKGAVDKRSLKCEHCDEFSHDKSTCFKLHGVPDWYKELGDQKRKSNAGHRAYAIQQGTELKEVTKDNTTCVSDMVMALVRVLKQIPHDPIQANHTGEYAGMNFTFYGVEYLNKDAWIIDSGATSHMCSDSKAFHTLNKSASVLSIFLPDGSTKQVTQSGFVNLFGKIKLVTLSMFPLFALT
ncbi:UNVERIFIED_CONTAM: hypothetical protein Scaly_2215400 [Sesamum calycinum]|uniref:Retrovirus-related Pol polyprotein from transposon TNT 1-94-like beta-barrel domain-containing protein n=1 Tax=Sesamum calycinum TaxID=2727403 RepID=A0AAW2MNP4_9LAMI